ncbi:MAG TPA: FAD-dependent oxidoreductase [Opitutales bacterium]|nr:FAD-dependent oxidoreductase [Opitutales bacterium]
MATLDQSHFDAVIIGAGMSGLAAGIRLALFEKNVVILERHNAPGGLNSFYFKDGRKHDVGLHAMTNYVPPGPRAKGAPLTKIFRQLRLTREDFDLAEQNGSRIAWPGASLRFTNDFAVLEDEVARVFPQEADNFRRLDAAVRAAASEAVALDTAPRSARAVLAEFIRDPVLTDMLLLPLMYYGSAQEHDMEWPQFCIMWQALYREGFARPFEGVRKIIHALTEQYRKLGGKRVMKCGVKQLRVRAGQVHEIELDDGRVITAGKIISSAGLVETLRLCDDQPPDAEAKAIGRLSFVETIAMLDTLPHALGWDDTIIFFNDAERLHYLRPAELVDPRSGVICCPNNYQYSGGRQLAEGVLRVTAQANFDRWMALAPDATAYAAEKKEWYARLQAQALKFLPGDQPLLTLERHTLVTDMFTPRTVKHFTGHLAGAIYGASRKVRDGRTHLANLYLCGTDQGFLGITGAMLSGITIANVHVLGAGGKE